jgi:dihydropteroate synthase
MKKLAKIKLINNIEEAKMELKKIGVSKEGIKIMAPKLVFRVIKLDGIDIRAANILKQEMLSLGGEAALSKGVIDFSVKLTDVLLAGTIKHYELLINKLKKQPFGLAELGKEIKKVFAYSKINPPTLATGYSWGGRIKLKNIKCGNYKLDFGKTIIMGVLNLTPDSFSDGGLFTNVDKAVEHGKQMVKDGADIIDIGGESSKPGSIPVLEKEELKRVKPVIQKLVKEIKVPISIDTYKPNVAKECLNLGASIVNDITGLRNREMIKIVAKYKTPVIIMHMKGMPKNMQENPVYQDVVDEIKEFLEERINEAKKSGINDIVIDPGIGFGKTTEHNLQILKRLNEFKTLGCPILVGPSRKSFIGNITGLPVNERLEGTLSSISIAIINGANIIRVHDVKECKRAAQTADAIRFV